MFSKLPWSDQKDGGQQHEDGESLTTILSPDQRSELTLLIASCTASMRVTITDAFSTETHDTEPFDTASLAASLPSDAENPNLEQSTTDDPESQKIAIEKAKENARQEKEKWEKELSGPAMQAAKAAALEHFDAWQESVLTRVGEVVNSKSEAASQKHHAHASPTKAPNTKVKESDTEPEIPPSQKSAEEAANDALRELYPPIATPLAELPEEKRALILHSTLLLLLSLEHYSAHSRVLLLHLLTSLQLPLHFLVSDEKKVATGLLTAALTADEETRKKAESNATARKWKVGLASVAGAAIIGVTGGLAAPLLAAGVGSVMGGLGLGATAAAGYLGALAGSGVIVGGLFGAYGAKMTGEMVDAYAREVEDFKFLPLHKEALGEKDEDVRRLRVAIGISGWLTEVKDVQAPWWVLGEQGVEGFALRYEVKALLGLGNALTAMLKSYAWGVAKNEIIKRTVFASLTAALWPLGLLKVGRVVDNPFSVARSRSDKAGEVLADALINKVQGERPVTLVGYSLGARLVYQCLMSLAERKAFGLVENVVLMGAPAPSDAAAWRKIRSLVTGRVVNAYSSNDYVLAFLYRTSSIQFGVAGLQPIRGVKGVQNVDVSDIVQGHTQYRFLVGSILRKIGFEDVKMVEVEKQEQALEEARLKEDKGEKAQEKKTDEDEAVELEREVEERNKVSMMGWLGGKVGLTKGTGKPEVGGSSDVYPGT